MVDPSAVEAAALLRPCLTASRSRATRSMRLAPLLGHPSPANSGRISSAESTSKLSSARVTLVKSTSSSSPCLLDFKARRTGWAVFLDLPSAGRGLIDVAELAAKPSAHSLSFATEPT